MLSSARYKEGRQAAGSSYEWRLNFRTLGGWLEVAPPVGRRQRYGGPARVTRGVLDYHY